MIEEFHQLLDGKNLNKEKVKVTENSFSIDIVLLDEDGTTTYGYSFHTAYQAYTFLEDNECFTRR